MTDDATVEEAIIKTVNLDDPKFRKVSIEDLEFYLSSKKGKVKDDFPPIDKSQKISKVNYTTFIIVHKNHHKNLPQQTPVQIE